MYLAGPASSIGGTECRGDRMALFGYKTTTGANPAVDNVSVTVVSMIYDITSPPGRDFKRSESRGIRPYDNASSLIG